MSTQLARKLRRDATEAETKLWNLLRSRKLSGYRFRRQHPIENYVADFACPQYRLIIEADGGQHNGNSDDEIRTKQLYECGWQVLRFWNNDILANSDCVLQKILEVMQKRLQQYQQTEQSIPYLASSVVSGDPE